MVISSHHYAKIFDHSAAVQRQKTLTSIFLKWVFAIYLEQWISVLSCGQISCVYFVLFC